MKVKLSVLSLLRLTGGVEVQLRSFLTSALDGGKWSTTHTGRFTHGKGHRYPLNRRLGGPQTQHGLYCCRDSNCGSSSL
jgi:hypothetical protein